MDRRKATLGVALAGVVAGAVGLGFLAAPAGAGQSPTLPSTTPDALVQSVLTAKLPALAGTVQVDNNLGLPTIPGVPEIGNGTSKLRVWSDGAGKGRLSIPSASSEQTYVDDGTTAYQWDSATRTVTEHSIKSAATGATGMKAKPADPGTAALNPATAAKEILAAVRASSTVSVDGTDMVANRPAYDLVLTPKPDQRTLLREVKIAIDATAHIPIQVTVLGNNSTSPALQVGFASLDLGPQDPALFTFTPPPGSTVVNGDKDVHKSVDMANEAAPKLVGTAWDTVVVAQLPGQLTGSTATGKGPGGADPLSLVRRFGKPVSGTWGSGWVISTDIGTALITSDGRVAAGFVPQQVLIQALGSGK